MIENRSLKILEYHTILSKVSNFAYSGTAKNYIMNLQPISSLSEAQELLNQTAEADKILYEHSNSPSFAFDDISDTLESAEKQAVLSISQIIRVSRVLRVARNFKSMVLNINDDSLILSKRFASNLYINPTLEDSISTSFLNDNEVADNASDNLRNIRNNIRNCNAKIKQKLSQYISQSQYSTILQDNIITMRNNRYVVPVKSQYKGQMSGLVHDQSSTGATLFIEPMVVVELNNELRTYELQEKQEIDNILTKFSFDISQELQGISTSFYIITQLDSIFAKAQYAKSIKAINPILNNQNKVNIKKGRHPLINPKNVVPIDVSLGYDYDVLVITGPNTGGKTVTLKLVGLFSLMAMSGIFIPAQKDSELCVFDNIFCDIGDEQSIEQSLSTFSSHLTNLTHITNSVTKNSLVLLDELGAGTDPVEGSALAVATIDYFRKIQCLVMTTSHYNELKEYSFVTSGVKNASMDFNPITYEPTYKLLIGLTGNSNALQIAKRLGLSPEIIQNAQSRFSQEKINFDQIIAGAEKARREAEELKEQAKKELDITKVSSSKITQQLEEVQKLQEKLNSKLNKGLKDLLADYNWEADELIEQLKEKVKDGNEKALFEARAIRNKLGKISISPTEQTKTMQFDKSPIEIGDKVFIKKLNNIGEIVAINDKKNQYSIKVGIMTTTVKKQDIQKIVHEQQESKSTTNIKKEFSNIACPMEINLIGQNTDEAIYNIDQYLSDASMSNYDEVRVIHGKGTGALRKALHEHFKVHPLVKSFRLGQYGEGENGATIVALK